MTMRNGKDVAMLLDQVRSAGGEVVAARSGHWKIYVGGQLVTTISGCGSDVRGLRNARAILRRYGLPVARRRARSPTSSSAWR